MCVYAASGISLEEALFTFDEAYRILRMTHGAESPFVKELREALAGVASEMGPPSAK